MENIQSLISGCWDRGKIHPEDNSGPWEGDNSRTTHFYYCWHFLCLQKRELLNKKGLCPESTNVKCVCKHFCPAPVWAREGSPQIHSPLLPQPRFRLWLWHLCPPNAAVNSRKMMHLVSDHNVLCFLTLQTIPPAVGLCRAGTEQQHHNTTSALPGSPTNASCYPPTGSRTLFFSLPGAFLSHHTCRSPVSALLRLAARIRLNVCSWEGIFSLCKRWIREINSKAFWAITIGKCYRA